MCGASVEYSFGKIHPPNSVLFVDGIQLTSFGDKQVSLNYHDTKPELELAKVSTLFHGVKQHEFLVLITNRNA